MINKAVILIIEDDPEIQDLLSLSMLKEGWKLLQAKSGEEGIQILKSTKVNCILLDIMLPGIDGLKVLKKIKEIEQCADVPVIMTTAKGEDTDIVAGLELGADDYVVKPYSPRVLAARIRAGLRRKEMSKTVSAAENKADVKKETVFQHGNLKIDIEKYKVFLGKTQLDLPATEFAILSHFMSHPDIVFTRQKLITAIRGHDYPVTDRSVDVQILGLRKKLGEAGDIIETIRGVGYRLSSP